MESLWDEFLILRFDFYVLSFCCPERNMELLILIFVIIGALIVIASGIWVAITLITGNRQVK
jgi:uncharacterized membrane protein